MTPSSWTEVVVAFDLGFLGFFKLIEVGLEGRAVLGLDALIFPFLGYPGACRAKIGLIRRPLATDACIPGYCKRSDRGSRLW
jgi:hypothetical protein